MNLHNPARYPGETREAYQERRILSAQAVRIATKGPQQEPANPVELKLNPLIWRRYWLGQHEAEAKKTKARWAVEALGKRQARRKTKMGYREKALAKLTQFSQENNLYD